MAFRTVHPADNTLIKEFSAWETHNIEAALSEVADATPQWADTSIAERCELLRRAAAVLRADQEKLAQLITLEMGKLINEARAEVAKCALVCDYYAEHGPRFLEDELIATDARRSFVAFQPLGTVLAVMPWNFPLWQLFRFAAPALVAGNTAVLKHASNVPQCALAIEQVFLDAGFPQGVFRTLMIAAKQVAGVIGDPRIHAVTLTGSGPAGEQVAATAGKHLKKSVLELGGADPFIVLEDADIDAAAQTAVTARFLNAGQSCIAAKRFIVVEAIAEAFVACFKAGTEALVTGDPFDESTTLAPMARGDLRDELHRQVESSIAAGAEVVTGCVSPPGPGAFYPPSILDRLGPGMVAYGEELFGPVASIIRVRDEEEALLVANATPFGLGSSVWTADVERGERLARKIQAGACFVNGMVKSDPRLPFGGIKASGYGRELSRLGLLEFVNCKSIWIK